MKFKYRKLNFYAPFSKKRILRPVIPISIKIKNSKRKVRYEALIDSGADLNILPIGLVEVLNINPANLKEIYFSGIDGDIIRGLIAEVIISLDDSDFITKTVFAEISGTIGVLGQYGFFDKFTIKFDLKREEIEVKSLNFP